MFVTRDRVHELLRQGLSRREVADRLGLSKATVSYHARRLGEPVDERFARRYDWPAIQAYYDAGHTPTECRDQFGCSIPAWQDARRRGFGRIGVPESSSRMSAMSPKTAVSPEW